MSKPPSPFEVEIRQFCKELELACEQAEVEAQAGIEHNSQEAGFRDDNTTAAANGSDKEIETVEQAADRAKRERNEVRCLLEFMDRDMADIFDIKRQISDKSLKEVAFEHLWLLFRPGSTAYHSNSLGDISRCQAYRIIHVTGGRVCFDSSKKSSFNAATDRKWESESETEERCCDIVKSSDHEVTSFIIDCFYMDSDGLRVGPRPKRFVIPRYRGARPVNWLPLFPSGLHPESHRIEEALLTRGKQYIELATGAHKKYEGNTVLESNQTKRPYHNFLIEDAEVWDLLISNTPSISHANS